MLRNVTIIPALLCLLTLTASAQDKWQMPETPLGHAISALLTTIEDGGEAEIRAFVEKHFDSGFKDVMPLSQHIEALQNAHQVLDEFTVEDIRLPGDYTAELVLRAAATGELFKLEVEIAEGDPHGITGLMVEPYRVAEPPPPPPSETQHPDTLAMIEGELGGKLHDFMLQQERNGFSGAVYVVKNGKTILSRGYGWADRERQIPNISQTVFDIASYSKAFTEAAILQLEQNGKLSTNDPITEFFENVPDDKRGITIHHLLTFRSGLHEYHDTEGDFEQMTKDEAFARIMAQELRFTPGSDWGYSNSGFTLLAMIIEKLSGEGYEEYCHRHLFEPAAMLHTGFWQDPRWRAAQVAHGYDARQFGEENSPYYWPKLTWATRGNGGACSSPADQARWLWALNSGRILQGAALEKLHAVYKKPVQTDWAGATRAFAEGNDFGFTNASFEFPDDDSFLFVAANSDTIPAPRVAEKLAKLMFGVEP